MAAESNESGESDLCYRCGYDVRGIANEHPCPECGLLAERSRRVTDELHNTRPRWLRRLSLGVWLILLALAAAAIWPFVSLALITSILRSYAWAPPVWVVPVLENSF